MRVGVVLSPSSEWPAIVEAAQLAEASGLDAAGFVDRFHSAPPENAQICGWAAYGALAMATRTIRLVPMVLVGPNYPLGVLAKESSVLGIVSGGRFELGIGTGDYPEADAAWGKPVAEYGQPRADMLRETLLALRRLWHGTAVSVDGTYVRLVEAACTPVPPVPPRVVVGAGSSRLLIRAAAELADEVNVYADERLLRYARETIAASGRSVDVSMLRWFRPGEWPADLPGELGKWAAAGVKRLFVNVGTGAAPARRVAEIAAAL